MIRILYNNGIEMEYESISHARLMIANVLLVTHGRIIPVEAVEVLGVMPSGEILERVLDIKLGMIELV